MSKRAMLLGIVMLSGCHMSNLVSNETTHQDTSNSQIETTVVQMEVDTTMKQETTSSKIKQSPEDSSESFYTSVDIQIWDVQKLTGLQRLINMIYTDLHRSKELVDSGEYIFVVQYDEMNQPFQVVVQQNFSDVPQLIAMFDINVETQDYHRLNQE